MVTIHLDKLKFFARHGVFEEETMVGNHFEVTATISFEPGVVKHLNDTIDYTKAYEIIKSHFQHPRQLLETLAQDIIKDLSTLGNNIREINVYITKIGAPISNFNGNIGVSIKKVF